MDQRASRKIEEETFVFTLDELKRWCYFLNNCKISAILLSSFAVKSRSIGISFSFFATRHFL